MKLIIGLGNPGEEYKNTRHNIGFNVIDYYANSNNLGTFSNKFNAMYLKTTINNEQIIFLKPLTYMNLSGEAVLACVNYYHIDINDILVIHDDLDLPVGKIRLRIKGSCGGHNGIRNIIDLLKTENIKRIKIGIANNKLMDTKDYVLGKFSKEDNDLLEKTYQKTNKIIDDYLNNYSFDKLMCTYNGEIND